MKKIISLFLAVIISVCFFASCKKSKPKDSYYSSLSYFEEIPNQSETKEQVSESKSEKPVSNAKNKTSPLPSAAGEIVDVKIDKSDLKQVETGKVRVKQDRLTVFSSLSSTRQEIYKKMLKAAEDFTDGWIDLGNLSGNQETIKSDISVAYQALGDDYPELFWLPSSYFISSYSNQTAVCFSGDINGFKCSYLVSKAKAPAMKNELDAKVNEIIKATENISSQYETELYIHDYLCSNTEYDLNAEFKYSAYGALVSKRAVCEGYSRAFSLLCSKAGINSFIKRGTSRGQNHSWNIVNIENNWYNIDVTWDDQTSNGANSILYSYFNLTDSEISSDHISAAFTDPKNGKISSNGIYDLINYTCSSVAMNYFNKENLILKNNEYYELSKAIALQNSKGKNSAQIKTDSSVTESPAEIMSKLGSSMARTANLSLKSMSTVNGTNYLLIKW